jgi:hypothetical protein
MACAEDTAARPVAVVEAQLIIATDWLAVYRSHELKPQ